MAPPPKTSPYRLLVEGSDDQHSIVHLLTRNGYDWDDEEAIRPYIHDSRGVKPLLESITTHVKSQERLGVVLDADQDLSSRWRELRERFGLAGIDLPAFPDQSGLVMTVGSAKLQRLGVWVMPDNSVSGFLEHFLAKLVPAGEPLWGHAESATTQALALGASLRAQDHVKGALYSWLAWQETPGLPFGTALRATILSHDTPEARSFVTWFRRMFSEANPPA